MSVEKYKKIIALADARNRCQEWLVTYLLREARKEIHGEDEWGTICDTVQKERKKIAEILKEAQEIYADINQKPTATKENK